MGLIMQKYRRVEGNRKKAGDWVNALSGMLSKAMATTLDLTYVCQQLSHKQRYVHIARPSEVENLATVTHAFITIHLDYRNTLYLGLLLNI